MKWILVNLFLAFEVMDKEPPLWWVCLFFGGIGVVGFFLCRRWPKTSLIILPVAAFFGWGLLGEIQDPTVGPAIVQEAGIEYVIGSYIAIGLSVAMPLFGSWLAFRRKVLTKT